MKKKLLAIMLSIITVCMLATGCASLERLGKDINSDFSGGLNRIVTVYNANGDILKQFEGKIDFETTEGGYVKFDYNGKRYMYYNCFVEAIEK